MEAKPLFDQHGNLTLEAANRYANGALSETERARVDAFLADSGMDADVLDDYDGAAQAEVASMTTRVNERVVAAAGTTSSGGIGGWLAGAMVIVFLGALSWWFFPAAEKDAANQSAGNSQTAQPPPEQPEDAVVFDSVSIGGASEAMAESDEGSEAPGEVESAGGEEERPTREADSQAGREAKPGEEAPAEPESNKLEAAIQQAHDAAAGPEDEMVYLRFAISSKPVYKNDKQAEKNADNELAPGKREERAIMTHLKTNAYKPKGLQRGGQALFFLTVDDKGNVETVRTAKGHSPNLDTMMVDLLHSVALSGTDEKVEAVTYEVLVTF